MMILMMMQLRRPLTMAARVVRHLVFGGRAEGAPDRLEAATIHTAALYQSDLCDLV
jgi:hypothetical protein